MVAQLQHRGPDDEQLYIGTTVALGFRRLSIIDLAGGAQPLTNEDESLVLVANGEIYNHRELRRSLTGTHRFKTDSDCEILLHLYEERGLNLLDDLVGMYAFALWDRAQQRVFLARDRFGIKPLYYARLDDQLIFASELKSVLQHPACPRTFDWSRALSDTILTREPATCHEPVTSFFEGIHHLPAATVLTADLTTGAVHERRYWHLPSPEESGDCSDADFVEEYRALFEDAVENCLMSDVEHGLLLSGGIDSAAIAAVAAARRPFHAFTVLGRSTLGTGDAEYAARLSSLLGLPCHHVLFDGREGVFTPDEWRRLLWLCETPVCGPEQLYKYQVLRYAKHVRPGLKVMLNGQGSDEFNGGYSTVVTDAGAQDWGGFQGALLRLERRGLFQHGAAHVRIWDERTEMPILSQEFLRRLGDPGARGTDPLRSYQLRKYRDLQMYNCWHEDRTASGNGIEARVPFLDHRLVEMTFRVPAARRSTLFWDKHILREALAGRLPELFRRRPKVPFFYGDDVRHTDRILASILLARGGELLEEAFSTPGAREVFDRDVLDTLIETLRNDPEARHAQLLLRLANMGLLESMAATLSMPAPWAGDGPVLPALLIKDWDSEQEAVESRMAACGGTELSGDTVLALAENVALMRREDAGGAGCTYLAVDDELTYLVSDDDSPGWLEVLRRLDGHSSLASVISATATTVEAIRARLKEAIDLGVVSICPRNSPEEAHPAATVPI